jgi:hypothetical protein
MAANVKARSAGAGDAVSAMSSTKDNAAQAAVSEAFLAAYRTYLEALRDIHARVQRRYFDVQADYARAVHESQCKSHTARADAFRTYVSRMHDARGDEAHRLACDAEHQYMKDIEAAQSAEQQALTDANGIASAAVQQANDQAAADRDAARLAYSTGVRDGFAKSDPQALEPDVLALIGQSLVAASNVSGQHAPH